MPVSRRQVRLEQVRASASATPARLAVERWSVVLSSQWLLESPENWCSQWRSSLPCFHLVLLLATHPIYVGLMGKEWDNQTTIPSQVSLKYLIFL
ncbi:hypothetical protein RRG08_044714 [Elysia crispata]|uniref:Uncharacterized protein n=1 Tax=Elysia crispata TaxID=231223 RepID=A0AAE0XX24_9GAST|nr:hypothetical protein RRG08_044714 [Elysia crispata]